MDTPESIRGSHDGPGAADHDQVYRWGQPKAYLTTMQEARLLVMRGYVRDFLHGATDGAANGDVGYGHLTAAGIWVAD